MKLSKVIKILEEHNAWRRGDDNYTMGCVKELGIAIDTVIKITKALNENIDSMKQTNQALIKKCKKLEQENKALQKNRFN